MQYVLYHDTNITKHIVLLSKYIRPIVESLLEFASKATQEFKRSKYMCEALSAFILQKFLATIIHIWVWLGCFIC